MDQRTVVSLYPIYHEDISTIRDPEKMQQLGEWEEGNLTAALDKNLLSRFTADADAADIYVMMMLQ